MDFLHATETAKHTLREQPGCHLEEWHSPTTTNINLEKVFTILQTLQPITLPYTDRENRVIQLWHVRKDIFGGTIEDQ